MIAHRHITKIIAVVMAAAVGLCLCAAAFSDQITIEYVADPALNDEQCMIETSSGVFDCSVDTEFQNLINDLRSLT